jgi:hypothetical protein
MPLLLSISHINSETQIWQNTGCLTHHPDLAGDKVQGEEWLEQLVCRVHTPRILLDYPIIMLSQHDRRHKDLSRPL